MSSTKLVITDQEENGLRLQLLLDKCDETLKNFFHRSYSRDPSKLYNELLNVKSKLKYLKQRGLLSQTQWYLLLPKNQMTDASVFDVTLTSLLIREICNVKAPHTGWSKDPCAGDRSDGANVVRIRHARNFLQHHSIILNHNEYQRIWTKLSTSMIGFGCDPQEIINIRQKVLDVGTIQKLQQVENDLVQSKSVITHLQNCLESIWWNVSPSVHNFTGREEEIIALHETITKLGNLSYGVVITGMGGVGKTEMAKHYCYSYGEEYFESNVVWIDADGTNALESSFYKIAEYLEIPVKDLYGNASNLKTIAAKVYRFFANRKGLFVFDNVHDLNEMEDFLPTSLPSHMKKPTILITSQFTNWGNNFITQNLGTFSKRAAERFIADNLTRECYQNKLVIEELASLVEFLPLALQQAVSYIQRNQITIGQYIHLFNENSKAVFTSSVTGMLYKHTVFTTWNLALEKLRNMKAKLPLHLIRIMSFLHGKFIQKDILITDVIKETEINEALSVLLSYSLVSVSRENNKVNITMHSLMQIVVRETSPLNYADLTLDLLQKRIKMSTLDQFHFGDGWMEHIMNVFQVSNFDKRLMQRFFELRICIKQALLNKGKFIQCANFSRFVSEQIKPNVTPEISHIYNDIKSDVAKSLQYAGRFEEANAIFMDIINEEESLRLHHRVLMKRYSLAICYLFQGNYTDSYSTLKSVKEAIIHTWGELSPSLNGVEHALGLCLMNTGKFHKALKIFKDVEEYGEQNYKKITKMNEQYDIMRQEGMLPEVLTVRSCIATCLSSLGKNKKALKLFQEVEDKRREELGDLHPLTLQEKCNTATCLAQKFSLERGMELLHEVQTQQIEMLEDKLHPHVLNTKFNIATSYMKRKRYEPALGVFEPLLYDQCLVLGQDHPKSRITNQYIVQCKDRLSKRGCIRYLRR